MAKTYNASQLATSDVYKVRFATGDHRPCADDMLLDDAEIEFLISTNTSNSVVNLRNTAIAALDAMLRMLADEVSYSKGKISEQASQRYAQFKAERDRLASGGSLFGNGDAVPTGIMYGGILKSQVDAARLDRSIVPFPVPFDRDLDDHPGNPTDYSEDD